jgi:hypothetical protein
MLMDSLIHYRELGKSIRIIKKSNGFPTGKRRRENSSSIGLWSHVWKVTHRLTGLNDEFLHKVYSWRLGSFAFDARAAWRWCRVSFLIRKWSPLLASSLFRSTCDSVRSGWCHYQLFFSPSFRVRHAMPEYNCHSCGIWSLGRDILCITQFPLSFYLYLSLSLPCEEDETHRNPFQFHIESQRVCLFLWLASPGSVICITVLFHEQIMIVIMVLHVTLVITVILCF